VRSLFSFPIFFFVLAAASVFAVDLTDAEKRRDTIRYGLESDVTDLISTLESEKDDSFNADLSDLFGKTKNSAVRDGILSFFGNRKNPALSYYCLKFLEDPYDSPKSTVSAVLTYIQEIKLVEAAPLVRKILETDSSDYRDKAIKTLGKIGSPEDAGYLVKYMDSDIAGDEKQRLIIRQNVMDALGELKAVETWDKLVEIVKDKDENAMIRASAASALGKMQKEESISVLIAVCGESDPVIRSAAIEGLSNFHTKESNAVILEGIKDSYYKVRLAALNGVEKNMIMDSLPSILYRAKTDPVEAVKIRSFEVLGKLRAAEADEWLASVFRDEKASERLRVKAASVLVENNRASIQADFERVAQQAAKDDKKKAFRYALGKIIVDQRLTDTASIAQSYIASKDAETKGLGLDMYDKMRYPELTASVEAIAADAKQGGLHAKAERILGEKGAVSPATP
jgi:HEAT repeat protein